MSNRIGSDIESGNSLANTFDNAEILVFGGSKIGNGMVLRTHFVIGSLALTEGLNEMIEAPIEHFERDAVKGQVHFVSDSIAEIDNLLTGAGTGTITYFNNADAPNASTTLTVTVNDQGNSGIDPGLTGDAFSEEGSASVTLKIAGTNDAPVFTSSGPYSIDENASAGTVVGTVVATDPDIQGAGASLIISEIMYDPPGGGE